MYYPAHIDGCSVVILRRHGLGYVSEQDGILAYDGETLSLVLADAKRVFLDEEINSLKPVVEGNSIPECKGFDFFLIT